MKKVKKIRSSSSVYPVISTPAIYNLLAETRRHNIKHFGHFCRLGDIVSALLERNRFDGNTKWKEVLWPFCQTWVEILHTTDETTTIRFTSGSYRDFQQMRKRCHPDKIFIPYENVPSYLFLMKPDKSNKTSGKVSPKKKKP